MMPRPSGSEPALSRPPPQRAVVAGSHAGHYRSPSCMRRRRVATRAGLKDLLGALFAGAEKEDDGGTQCTSSVSGRMFRVSCPVSHVEASASGCLRSRGGGAERPLRVLCLHGKYENAAGFAVRTEFLDDCEPVDGLREVRIRCNGVSGVSGWGAHCEAHGERSAR